ncbi:MAG: T9SS type A sorting domain-containing protein, partial [Flavobacteriales bacterium]
VYPNPAHDEIWIDIPNDWQHMPDVLISDMQGRTIQLEGGYQYGKIKLQTASLTSGNYLVQLRYGHQMRSTTFIKK